MGAVSTLTASLPPGLLSTLHHGARHEVSICEPGARIGNHGVAVERSTTRRSHWYLSEAEAKGGFVRRVADLRVEDDQPVLIQRIEERQVVEAVFYSRGLEGLERVALEARASV